MTNHKYVFKTFKCIGCKKDIEDGFPQGFKTAGKDYICADCYTLAIQLLQRELGTKGR